MESIVRNVRDIDGNGRQTLEHLLGQKLQDNHQLIVQVVTLRNDTAGQNEVKDGPSSNQLPDWCNVYAGLDEHQIAEIEEVSLQRADLSRSSE